MVNLTVEFKKNGKVMITLQAVVESEYKDDGWC